MYSFIKNHSDKNHLRFNEFPSFFDDVLTREFFHKSKKAGFHTTPSVNIKETESAFELEVAAPGLEKKNFKLELNEDKLTISSVHETATEEKNDTTEAKEAFSRREFNYHSFSRSFILPEKLIDKEAIAASYENGILNVSIPKKEKSTVNQNREIRVS
jgi:HSP20 family protein